MGENDRKRLHIISKHEAVFGSFIIVRLKRLGVKVTARYYSDFGSEPGIEGVTILSEL